MFKRDFAPDARFNYRRDRVKLRRTALPKRFIRAYRLRDPKTGRITSYVPYPANWRFVTGANGMQEIHRPYQFPEVDETPKADEGGKTEEEK